MLTTPIAKKIFVSKPPEMTTAQANVLSTTGNQVAGILEGIEGKVTPEFYEHAANAFVFAYSQLQLAVGSGWKGNY